MKDKFQFDATELTLKFKLYLQILPLYSKQTTVLKLVNSLLIRYVICLNF